MNGIKFAKSLKKEDSRCTIFKSGPFSSPSPCIMWIHFSDVCSCWLSLLTGMVCFLNVIMIILIVMVIIIIIMVIIIVLIVV